MPYNIDPQEFEILQNTHKKNLALFYILYVVFDKLWCSLNDIAYHQTNHFFIGNYSSHTPTGLNNYLTVNPLY